MFFLGQTRLERWTDFRTGVLALSFHRGERGEQSRGSLVSSANLNPSGYKHASVFSDCRYRQAQRQSENEKMVVCRTTEAADAEWLRSLLRSWRSLRWNDKAKVLPKQEASSIKDSTDRLAVLYLTRANHFQNITQ